MADEVARQVAQFVRDGRIIKRHDARRDPSRPRMVHVGTGDLGADHDPPRIEAQHDSQAFEECSIRESAAP
jgi:hypothetical protein